MTTAQHGSMLRPEARALDYRDLDGQQQAAYKQIMTMISEAASATAEAEPEATSRPSRPNLDAERSSRAALIYGQRGSGKTTLLLSLLKALDGAREARDARKDTTDEAPSPRNVVLLETLDMEPLEESTNLIGAVLARLEAAVAVTGEPQDRINSRSRMGRAPDEETIMMQLADLQTRAASAFRSNLRQRAGALDPDNFAVEARRAERHRMDFGRQFARVVAEIAKYLKETRHDLAKSPLFVLPVDDLDLNPIACVPLLEGLRAVYSPHLLVLLLADLPGIDTVMRLYYQSRFIGAGGSNALDRPTQHHVHNLAANAVRKHLPPAQRVHLDRVSPAEAAASFQPLGYTNLPTVFDLYREAELTTDSVWLAPEPTTRVDAPPVTIEMAKQRWLPAQPASKAEPS